MKSFVTVLVTIGVIIVSGLIFAFSGIYDVSARTPHWGITHLIMDLARERSVEFHTSEVAMPSDPEKAVNRGFSHFHATCRRCHGAPSVSPEEFASGMYPKPPALTTHEEDLGMNESYWIISNGFKMTGMPAFADTHKQEEILDIAAFIQKLPEIGADEYQKMLGKAMAESEDHEHAQSHETAHETMEK